MGVGGQLHAPAALPLGKRPGTYCTGGWVGPRAGLDGCWKSRPHRDSIPGPSSSYRVAIPAIMSVVKSTRQLRRLIPIRRHHSREVEKLVLNGRQRKVKIPNIETTVYKLEALNGAVHTGRPRLREWLAGPTLNTLHGATKRKVMFVFRKHLRKLFR
jgi:hypothetical protein